MKVLLRQVEIPFYMSASGQCGRGFGTIAQIIRRKEIPILLKNVVSARYGLVLACWNLLRQKIQKLLAIRKSVRKQTLRKQLFGDNRRRKGAIGKKELAYGSQASRVIPTKSSEQTSRSRSDFFLHIFP